MVHQTTLSAENQGRSCLAGRPGASKKVCELFTSRVSQARDKKRVQSDGKKKILKQRGRDQIRRLHAKGQRAVQSDFVGREKKVVENLVKE